MDGVLNETTHTVHKHDTGRSDVRSVCGATNHVSRDRLRKLPVERALADYDARRCGRCFADAGGY